MDPSSSLRIELQGKCSISEQNKRDNGIATILERLVRWFFRFIISRVLERLGISLTAPFKVYTSQLFSFLFEVNTTVPWGLYLLGELIKKLNALTRRRNGTINRKVADLIEFKVPASSVNQGVFSKDVVIDPDTNVWVRIYTPSRQSTSHDSQPELFTESKLLPVLVYYHGGGFGVLCADQVDIDNLCRTMARTCNMVIVSGNYRRAPEYRYPIAYQDSFKVLQWLQSADSQAHLPPMADISQCFLAGESAGANIAHFMACQMAESEHGSLPLQIRGVILLQPFFGSEQRTLAEINLGNVPMISTEATDWHWEAFLPAGADRDHPACNVVGPKALDMSGLSLPPIFLVTGTLDLLIDHHFNYASRMREMRKSITVKNYIGGIHGFYFLEPVGVKIAMACIADVREFIQSCLP